MECAKTGMVLYANGQKLAQYPRHGRSQGTLGLIGLTNGGLLEAHFDNLVVRSLPEAPKVTAEEDSGRLIYADDFSSSEKIYALDSDTAKYWSFRDSALQASIEPDQNRLLFTPSWAFEDTSAQIEITRLSGLEKGYAGLTCRSAENKSYYDFVISADGSYSIGKQPIGATSRPRSIGEPAMRSRRGSIRPTRCASIARATR